MEYRELDQPPQRRRRFTESGERSVAGPRPGRRHGRGDDHGGHDHGESRRRDDSRGAVDVVGEATFASRYWRYSPSDRCTATR